MKTIPLSTKMTVEWFCCRFQPWEDLVTKLGWFCSKNGRCSFKLDHCILDWYDQIDLLGNFLEGHTFFFFFFWCGKKVVKRIKTVFCAKVTYASFLGVWNSWLSQYMLINIVKNKKFPSFPIYRHWQSWKLLANLWDRYIVWLYVNLLF